MATTKTFTVTGNHTVTVATSSILPSTNTKIKSVDGIDGWDIHDGEYQYTVFTFTVPSGVNVVLVKPEHEPINSIYVYKGNIASGSVQRYDNSGGAYEVYIGVTPGQTYTLDIGRWYESGGTAGYVYYSSTINTHTPDVSYY